MSAHEQAVAGADLIVPLHSRRRRKGQFAQRLQHVVAAAGLFFSGVQSLSAHAEGFERALAIGGIITAGALIAAFARELRGLRTPVRAHAHGIDWMDVFAALVLFAEAAEKWRLRGHIWRPETLAAIATLGVGLYHRRLAARKERQRSLCITAEGVVVGRRFFGSFKAPWSEIADITVGEREATIRTHGGKTRQINLADLENAPAVRGALQEAERRLVDCTRLKAQRAAVTFTS